MCNTVKPPPQSEEIKKLQNKFESLTIKYKRDLKVCDELSWEEEMKVTKEFDDNACIIKDLARQIAFEQPESAKLILNVANKLSDYQKLISRSSGESRRIIEKLQHEKTKRRNLSENKKYSTSEQVISKSIRKVTGVDMEARRCLKLENEIEKLLDKHHQQNVDHKSQKEALEEKISKTKTEKEKLKQMITTAMKSSNVGQGLKETLKSETKTKFLVFDHIPLAKTDIDIAAMLEPFTPVRTTGRFSGNAQMSHFACVAEFKTVEQALGAMIFFQNSKDPSDSKLELYFTKEFPTDKITIRPSIPKVVIQTFFEPIGEIKNVRICDDDTIIHFKTIKNTCTALLLFNKRKIMWKQNDQKIVENDLDLVFANDTDHVIWDRDYQSNCNKIENNRINLKSLNYVLEKLESEIQSSKVADTPEGIPEDEVHERIVADIETRIEIAAQKLTQLQKQSREEIRSEEEKIKSEFQGEINQYKRKINDKDRDFSKTKNMLDQRNRMYHSVHKELKTRRSIERRKWTKEGDQKEDEENNRNMVFLEAQVDKLQKERDRLKLAVEQFMDGNNKGFESQNPGKLQLMFKMEKKENDQLKHEIGLLQKTVSRREKELEDHQKMLETLKLEIIKINDKMQLQSDEYTEKREVSISTEVIQKIVQREKELRIENEHLRAELAQLTHEIREAKHCTPEELAKLKKRRDEVMKNVEASQIMLHTIEEEIANLRSQLQAERRNNITQIKQIDMKLTKLDGKVIDTIDRTDTIHRLHDKLEAVLEDGLEERNNIEGELKSEGSTKDKKILFLEQGVRRMKQEMIELRRTHQLKLESIKNELEKCQMKSNELEIELQNKLNKQNEEMEKLNRSKELTQMMDQMENSEDGDTKNIMMELMRARDDALEKSATLQEEFDKKFEEFKATRGKLNQEIADLKSENKDLSLELRRIATAEDKLEKLDMENKVEKMIAKQRKKLDNLQRAITPETGSRPSTASRQASTATPPMFDMKSMNRMSSMYQPMSPLSPLENGDYLLTGAEHEKLMKKIERLKQHNIVLEKELHRIQLQGETLVKNPFSKHLQGGQKSGRMYNLVRQLVRDKNRQPLRLGSVPAPSPKVRRDVAGKWKMTKSRFLQITKEGENSHRPVKSLKWLKRAMSEIYDAKKIADDVAFRDNITLIALPDFIYHEFIPSQKGIIALVDTMCWDIHNSCEKFSKDKNWEVLTFKKFLHDELSTDVLAFYLKARSIVLKSSRSHEGLIESIHFDGIVDNVFDTCTYSYRNKLSETLEVRGLAYHGKPELDMYLMMDIFIEEYNHLIVSFRNQALKLFCHMGLHQYSCVEFADYIPLFRIMLAGVPEEKSQKLLERLQMPSIGLMPICQFEALVIKFSKLRLQFQLVTRPSKSSKQLENSLRNLIDHRWRDFEGDRFADVITIMYNLDRDYEDACDIRLQISQLKDKGKHLNMALMNELGWESFLTYFQILKQTEYICDRYEIGNQHNFKCFKKIAHVFR